MNASSDVVAGPRRVAVAFIFITVFLDVLAFGFVQESRYLKAVFCRVF